MRPLRYSINVTLDGCCDHRVMIADEDLHRHAAENLAQADPLLLAWEPTKLWSRVAAGGADGSGARLDANDLRRLRRRGPKSSGAHHLRRTTGRFFEEVKLFQGR